MQRASEFDFATAAPRQTASSGIFAIERATEAALKSQHTQVMEVMNLLCKAGYLKVAWVELEKTPVQINLALSDKCQVTIDLTVWLGDGR